MNFVLEKQLIKFSFTYQPLSICKTFIKKVLELIQSYEGVCHFWDQNSSFVLNKILLGINHCYSFIYLWPFSLCKISKKSYNGSRIMTMHHFWAQSGPFTSNNFFFFSWLRAIFAFTWELDFSQACSFLKMLMNHKNFDFTQIPGKTNDIIFLKSPKTMFWGHFWPFLPDRDFFQKMQLSHTTIYEAPTLP